jgi:hypothetical protein
MAKSRNQGLMMARDALRTVSLLAIAILTTVAVADVRQARAEDVKPAFNELVVKFEPTPLTYFFGQGEELKIESNGQCWYTAEGREARPNVSARSGGVIGHRLSTDRIERLNKLLKETQWLAAPGAEGKPPIDAGTIRLTLSRERRQVSVECHDGCPEPYASLLRELKGLAIQERRIYLHDYVSGKDGTDAWQEVGHELDALRGGPYLKSPFPIDYECYLPIATRNIRNFYGSNDDELIPAVRLIGQLQVKSEMTFLHRMAHDRSSHLRREVAWALRRIHDRQSLPVLEAMVSANETRWDVGFELIQWGDEAVPYIVDLISLSTKDTPEHEENTMGEDMIRAYLEHWNKLELPVDPRVVAEVRRSLESKNPQNGMIGTGYHREFLKKIAR